MINKIGSFEASYLKPRSTTRQGRLRAKVSTRVHSPENIIQTIGHLGKGHARTQIAAVNIQRIYCQPKPR
jgi:hypothetical protein